MRVGRLMGASIASRLVSVLRPRRWAQLARPALASKTDESTRAERSCRSTRRRRARWRRGDWQTESWGGRYLSPGRTVNELPSTPDCLRGVGWNMCGHDFQRIPFCSFSFRPPVALAQVAAATGERSRWGGESAANAKVNHLCLCPGR